MDEDVQTDYDQLLALLRSGAHAWNAWRSEHPSGLLDLHDAELRGLDLRGANLRGVSMQRAHLTECLLNGADLRGSDLREARLNGADLTEATLSQAVLLDAELYRANLHSADLSAANLRSATLSGANAERARCMVADFRGISAQGINLDHADLSGTQCIAAHLAGASLAGATLEGALLMQANLSRAVMTGADLSGANLAGATLTAADLSAVCLQRASLRQANLTGTKLAQADLTGADLRLALLIDTDLAESRLTNAHVFGASVWGANLSGAEQTGLIVSEHQAVLRVDNLEVAQFLYLMLRSQTLRSVIDTITSKVVLILGRFNAPHKQVLDALRASLVRHHYVAIVFDFEGPASRDLTETISLLAHMARFVVADLTEPRSVPQELTAIIPSLPSVPVQPIINAGEQEYAMFEHWRNYPWVLPIYRYQDSAALEAAVDDHVIGPAEARIRAQVELRNGPAD